MEMSLSNGLEQALAELAAAQAALEEAERATARARSEESACLKRANEAQKEVDDLVAAIREKAHRDTTWGRARQRGFPAAAD